MKKIWKNRYQIVEEAGKGGNGSVYKVWDIHLEKEWAMKIPEEKVCFGNEGDEKENMDELTALKKISHPNFPRIVDAFEEDGRNILIMDYIQGISLEKIIEKGPMKEQEMVWILSQVCEAILYLHQNTPTLLYLDLKPSNIIIEENRTVKLVDLGSVSIKGRRGKISGSFGYASPEQVRVQQGGIFLTQQSDIFSFGMVMYAMAMGNGNRLPVMETKNRYGVFIRRENPFLSVALERIVEKCTRGNCIRRYTSMREVKKELELWAKNLEKKRRNRFFFPKIRGLFLRKNHNKQWYQEKSIFCTEGRHSFYIAKKFLILCVGIFCLTHEIIIQAGEKELVYEDMEEISLAKENEEIIDGERKEKEELEVIIRDYKNRKVLVRDGMAYKTGSNVLLEIPWEEIGGEFCRIMVECENEKQEKRHFYIDCIYAEE